MHKKVITIAAEANEWINSLKVGGVFNGAMHEAAKRYEDPAERDIFAITAVGRLMSDVSLALNEELVITHIEDKGAVQ